MLGVWLYAYATGRHIVAASVAASGRGPSAALSCGPGAGWTSGQFWSDVWVL